MATDAFPVVDVSDEGMDPELHWLAQSRLCGVYTFQTADVANQSGIGFENPASSGVIAVLSRVDLWISVAGAVEITGAAAAAFTGSTPGFFRDMRGWPTTPLRATCRAGVNVGAYSATVGRLFLPANTVYNYDQQFIVTPGERLTIATAAINTRIDAAFYWRERQMVDEEFGD